MLSANAKAQVLFLVCWFLEHHWTPTAWPQTRMGALAGAAMGLEEGGPWWGWSGWERLCGDLWMLLRWHLGANRTAAGIQSSRRFSFSTQTAPGRLTWLAYKSAPCFPSFSANSSVWCVVA